MQDDRAAFKHAIQRLAPLVGRWRVEVSFAPPGAVRAETTFEWALDGVALLQRAVIEDPAAPDALCVIAFAPATGGYTQHYFDSRGVVRLYAMTFDDGVWELRREAPDFSPLSFSQRWTGRLDPDGQGIRGTWEKTAPDGTWERDFDLTYLRED
jgi:hypothetical protein